MTILYRLNVLNIYWAVLLITGILAYVFKNNKKKFVISATIVHTFVCGFRYMYMHGDLMNYAYDYYLMKDYGWTSNELLQGGRNSLFYIINKLVAQLSNGDFQVLLFVIALISSVVLGYIIYKYSPKPFISFLMWNCFGFYMFSFYSIKQTLAMAFLMLAAIGIFENKWKKFLIFTLIAGFIHFPAFVFIPAYFITRIKRPILLVVVFVSIFISVLLYRNNIVNMVSDLYYEGEMFAGSSGIGGKTLLMLGLLFIGYLLCGLSDDIFRKTFILISMASVLQLFSIYNNIFTRLADYYFQFIVLYAPLMLVQIHSEGYIPLMYFTDRSLKLIVSFFVIFSLYFYQYSTFRNANIISTDNLVTNFQFMWDVEDTNDDDFMIEMEQ